MLKQVRVAIVAAFGFCGPAIALQVDHLEDPPTPSGLTAQQVLAGGALTLTLPGRPPVVVSGTPVTPAPGMTGLAARSADRGVRLYAFVAGGQLQSAEVHGAVGHFRLMEFAGRPYWVPAAGTGAAVSPPSPLPWLSPVPPLPAARIPWTEGPGADGLYEVSVLMLHTPLYLERFGSAGAVEAEAQRLIFLTNAYLATNLIPVRFTVTGVAPYDGTDESQDLYANLESMVGNPAVTSLRDLTSSDLVVLLRTQDTAELCGLSSGFNGLKQSDPPTDIDPERDAFNVVAVGPNAQGGVSCNDTVLPHELGHSLAGGHDYATSAGFAYWKPYAHALPCFSQSGTTYFSLMWGTGVGPGGGRGDIITNPDALLGGRVCGAEGVPGAEPTQADNARVMTEAAPYVAAYRRDTKATARAEGSMGGLIGGFSHLLGLLLAAAWARCRVPARPG